MRQHQQGVRAVAVLSHFKAKEKASCSTLASVNGEEAAGNQCHFHGLILQTFLYF